MAISVFNLSPAQKGAASQIYSGFYNYALGKGADSGQATEFANLGLGVASGEGLGKADPWSTNADNGVTALGPFQLNLNSGVGSDFGLTANSPPQDQINAAASAMWGGNSSSYDTGPWNAVGNTFGGGNNSAAGQQGAVDVGSQLASANGLTGGGSPDIGTVPGGGSAMPGPAGQMGFGGLGAMLGKVPGLDKVPGLGQLGEGLGGGSTPGISSGQGGTDTGYGTPIVITDITAAGGKGAGPQIQKGLTQAGSDIKATGQKVDDTLNANTKSLTQEATSLGNFFSDLTSGANGLISRTFVAMIAIVLIGFGLWIAGKSSLQKEVT